MLIFPIIFNALVFILYSVLLVHSYADSKNIAGSIEKIEYLCMNETIALDIDFAGASRSKCKVIDNTFHLTIIPEDKEINPSPWYAFRLHSLNSDTQAIQIHMHYESAKHRYWPKVSTDYTNWQRLPQEAITLSEDNTRVDFIFNIGSVPTYLAAQPIISSKDNMEWMQNLVDIQNCFPINAPHCFELGIVGYLPDGSAIFKISNSHSHNQSITEHILLLGRAHPPEITGAQSMQIFVQTILADTELARKFRSRFSLMIVPNLNPLGVDNGYWRHNMQGVDLNRDWGAFTQAETRILRPYIDDLANTPDKRLVLMIDFHSTWKNVFYTQLENDPISLPKFTDNWLTNARSKLPNYTFAHEPRKLTDRGTSKNYFYRRFGIPAITYETGDDTEFEDNMLASTVFAEEMMKLLLATPLP